MSTTDFYLMILARSRNDAVLFQQIASVFVGIGVGVMVWWAVAKVRAPKAHGKINYKDPVGWASGILVLVLIIGGTFLKLHYDTNTVSDEERRMMENLSLEYEGFN